MENVSKNSEASTSESITIHASQKSVGTRRAERLTEYEDDVLNSSSPLKAMIGAMTCGLFKIQNELGDAISRAMAANKLPTTESVSTLLPALDTHLKYSRQIDRTTQISIQLDENEGKS